MSASTSTTAINPLNIQSSSELPLGADSKAYSILAIDPAGLLRPYVFIQTVANAIFAFEFLTGRVPILLTSPSRRAFKMIGPNARRLGGSGTTPLHAALKIFCHELSPMMF